MSIHAASPKQVLPVIKNVSGRPSPSAVELCASKVTVRLSAASHSKLKPSESFVFTNPPLDMLLA